MRIGYTQAYRKELDSDIWKMPPLYQRVFFYLRQTASWELEYFPTRKDYKIALNPGQLITSLSSIADGVSWYEYGVKKTPNKKTIKDILNWLERNAKVTVVSNRYGTFIIITNWTTYNSNGKEKVTPNKQEKVSPEKPQLDTLKEDKETKEEKKREKERKRASEKIMISNFDRFYKLYPKKIGKQKAKEAWKKQNSYLPEISVIIRAVKKQIKSSQWQKIKYIPLPATWINGRRWEDEVIEENKIIKPKQLANQVPEETRRDPKSYDQNELIA